MFIADQATPKGDTMAPTPPQRDDSSGFASFVDMLEALEGGQLVRDATDAMHTLSHTLRDHMLMGRKGKGTLKITINLTADRGLIEAIADVSVKEPALPRTRSAFYATGSGRLTREDPTQPNLPLHGVEDHPSVRRIRPVD